MNPQPLNCEVDLLAIVQFLFDIYAQYFRIFHFLSIFPYPNSATVQTA